MSLVKKISLSLVCAFLSSSLCAKIPEGLKFEMQNSTLGELEEKNAFLQAQLENSKLNNEQYNDVKKLEAMTEDLLEQKLNDALEVTKNDIKKEQDASKKRIATIVNGLKKQQFLAFHTPKQIDAITNALVLLNRDQLEKNIALYKATYRRYCNRNDSESCNAYSGLLGTASDLLTEKIYDEVEAKKINAVEQSKERIEKLKQEAKRNMRSDENAQDQDDDYEEGEEDQDDESYAG